MNSTNHPWYQTMDDRIILTLYIQPGAKRCEIAGLHGDALKIKLAAQAVEGQANKALLCFLSELFQVPQRQVELIKGSKSRHKAVKISGSKRIPDDILPTS